MKQGTDEWRAARLGIPTASRFSDVMATIKSGEAAGRRNYRAELVIERLTGTSMETYQSAAMRQGTEREPLARMEYEARTGVLVREVGLITHPEIQCGSSPDGLIDPDGGLEVKCPTPATHFEYLRLLAGECPSDYVWQVQGGMWICERQWWDFASYCPEFPEELRLIVRRVRRSEVLIDRLRTGIELFNEELDVAEKFAREYREPA